MIWQGFSLDRPFVFKTPETPTGFVNIAYAKWNDLIAKINALIKEFFEESSYLPESFRTFVRSFNHPSSIVSIEKSKLNDQVRFQSWEPILNAVWYGDMKYLNEIATEENVNFKDVDGATPLHAAALKGQIEAVKFLIAKGASIDAREMRGQTPMHWAASRGHVDVINLLQQYHASIHCEDHGGKTPLRMAAKRGHYLAVTTLASYGVPIDHKDGKGQTAYFVAMLHGQLKTAYFLKDMGANPLERNNDDEVADEVAGKGSYRSYLNYLYNYFDLHIVKGYQPLTDEMRDRLRARNPYL